MKNFQVLELFLKMKSDQKILKNYRLDNKKLSYKIQSYSRDLRYVASPVSNTDSQQIGNSIERTYAKSRPRKNQMNRIG